MPSTISEYRFIYNKPQKLSMDKVQSLQSQGDSSVVIFRDSSIQEMRDSLDSGSSVLYLVQKKTNYSEEELLEALKKASEDSRWRELLDHVHNVRAKVLYPMFDGFLVAFVKCFKDLHQQVQLLPKESNFHEALRKASKPFCDKYAVELDFWMQSAALEDINATRNKIVHCSIATSAAALIAACGSSDECPPIDSALAMVEALANYGVQHAETLEAAAEEQQQKARALTAQVKQKLAKKGSQ